MPANNHPVSTERNDAELLFDGFEPSEHPSYLPDNLDVRTIPPSLVNETQYWTTGRGQILSEEATEALMGAEALMTDLHQSDTLATMGLDSGLKGYQSLQGHCIRVAVLSLLINDNLKKYGSKAAANSQILATAGLLHDIGKLHPEVNSVIMSAQKIPKDRPEWEIIRKHPEYGTEVALAMPSMNGGSGKIKIAEAIYQHHERHDGSGYHKTPGPQISREASIIAVADTIDAMGEQRSYKGPIATRSVMSELERCRAQFDTEVLAVIRKIRSASGTFVKHRKSDRP